MDKNDILLYRKNKIGVDMKNNNSLLCTTMLATFWNEREVDHIDLISTFVKYILQSEYSTSRSKRINKQLIKKKLEQDYAFSDFPNPMIDKIISRLTHQKILRKTNNEYYLIADLSSEFALFEIEQNKSKSNTQHLLESLQKYLHDNCAKCKKIDLNDTRDLLIQFLENLGFAISSKEISYGTISKAKVSPELWNVAMFLSTIDKNGTPEEIDTINKIINGIYIAKVIYLTGEHSEETPPKSFNETSFYFDTSLVMALLGLKTTYENESANFLKETIQKLGDKVKCFKHTVEEIRLSIEAFKQANFVDRTRHYAHSIEFFTETKYSYSQVEDYLKLLEIKIVKCGIDIEESPYYAWTEKRFSSADAKKEYIDEGALLSYLTDTLHLKQPNAEADRNSISSIFLLRNGQHSNNIEKCRAIFVTGNIMLSYSLNYYLKIYTDKGVPTTITNVDLGAYLWAKTYKTDTNKYPLTQLIQNATAATRPTIEFYDAFHDAVEDMVAKDFCSIEEANALKNDRDFQTMLYNKAEAEIEIIPYIVYEEFKSIYELAEQKATSKVSTKLKSEFDVLQAANTRTEKEKRLKEIAASAESFANKWAIPVKNCVIYIVKGGSIYLGIKLFFYSVGPETMYDWILKIIAIIQAIGFTFDIFPYANKSGDFAYRKIYNYLYNKKIDEYEVFK